jgi:protein-disulfide isomerase
MKRLLLISLSTLALAACVDTTGLSPESSRTARGNADAFVTVVEYGDLQCPACKSAVDTINTPLLEQYGNQIRFEFKHFPLRSIHEYALELAEAAECSADQGKFWEFIDTAYAKQDQLSTKAITEWATSLGIDAELFNRCMKSDIKRDTILADYAAGEDAGVSGTPTYLVNGTKVESNLQAIGAAIQTALAGGGQRL